MKRALLYAVPVLALLTSLAVAEEERAHTTDSLETVKTQVADEKAVLIDVRERKEWDRGHVAGAIHVPLSELSEKGNDAEYRAALVKRLPKDKVFYVHCAAGKRCLLACDVFDLLEGLDFRPLKPGYRDLVEAGFEVEAAPPQVR